MFSILKLSPPNLSPPSWWNVILKLFHYTFFLSILYFHVTSSLLFHQSEQKWRHPFLATAFSHIPNLPLLCLHRLQSHLIRKHLVMNWTSSWNVMVFWWHTNTCTSLGDACIPLVLKIQPLVWPFCFKNNLTNQILGQENLTTPSEITPGLISWVCSA